MAHLLSQFDSNTNKILKTRKVDSTYKEAEQTVLDLNSKITKKNLYWKVTQINI